MSYTVWYNVVRPIAVGAMLVGAVYTLYSMRESILASIKGAFQAAEATAEGGAVRTRLDIDIPIKWIIISIAVLVVPITIIYKYFAHSWGAALMAAVVMTMTGFFLSAVGGYLVGLVGSSNQPVSRPDAGGAGDRRPDDGGHRGQGPGRSRRGAGRGVGGLLRVLRFRQPDSGPEGRLSAGRHAVEDGGGGGAERHRRFLFPAAAHHRAARSEPRHAAASAGENCPRRKPD